MPRSKRKTARRSAPGPDTSDLDFPDSSPSRPFAKRQRVKRSAARRRRSPVNIDEDEEADHNGHNNNNNNGDGDGDGDDEVEDEPSLFPDADPDAGLASGDGDDDNDEDEDDDDNESVSQGGLVDLVESVVQCLAVSRDAVAVAEQHANELSTDTSKINAYAKVAGRTWTYYIREQSINLGRPPDERQAAQAAVTSPSSPLADLREMMPVHIDLGPSKIVSRHHASIYYDAEVPDGGGWHVRVNGRNGVRVNNILLKRGTRQQITSGTILEIAGTQMMFVTANDPVQIAPYFIDQAKNSSHPAHPSHVAHSGAGIAAPAPVPASHAHPEPAGQYQFSSAPPSSSAQVPSAQGYPSLAPAPPHYRRTTTPPPMQSQAQQHGVFDSKAATAMSPMYGRGMLMESTQEIDYSRDSAKDLKPPYSYATMIAQAIFSSQEEKLTLSNIYSFIADKYAFYRHSNSGWQNSIRHNLSLNKAFQKVPRRTDEPGKGMKWQIAPEFRSEFYNKQAKRTTGSNPSSPASSKEVNPNFRGPNGQNLGYDTSMVSSFSAKDSSQGGFDRAGTNWQQQPQQQPQQQQQQQQQPGLGTYQLAPHPVDTSTPVRRRRADTGATQPDVFDDSPVHRGHANGGGSAANNNSNSNRNHNQPEPVYTLPSVSQANAHSPPTKTTTTAASLNATLSSSYLDTPFHPSQSSLLTPAPLRQNPRLAPPSTLVAPSKFMPDSSPAGPTLFWKGIMGVTPGAPVADMSPLKHEGGVEGKSGGGGGSTRHNTHRMNGEALALDRNIMSSSPPLMDAVGNESPTKAPIRPAAPVSSASIKQEGRDRDADGDILMRSRSTSINVNANTVAHSMSIAGGGPGSAPGSAPGPGPVSGLGQGPVSGLGQGRLGLGGLLHPTLKAPGKDDDDTKNDGVTAGADEDDGEEGFDLAKGFAPIAAAGRR